VIHGIMCHGRIDPAGIEHRFGIEFDVYFAREIERLCTLQEDGLVRIDKADWMRYLVTRYEPSDGPQTTMVGLMRSIFGSRVLTHPMVKSTAIADAGLTKQTLYEVERQQFTRGTYDRAIEALDLVNGEIEGLIKQVWGRK